MTKPLSLSSAAQAILDGFRAVPTLMDGPSIAGALRAAADQVVPLHICGTNATRAQTRLGIRHKLLAIAAELEGGND
jgi:hypothetical protein